MRQFLFILLFFAAGSFELFSAIDDFQSYIENRIDQSSNTPFYIYEASADQENDNTSFSGVYYRSESLSNNNILNLVDKILLKNNDVVCIQDILSDDEAYSLYIGLKKNYAHFLYMPPAKSLDSSESECPRGLLMVSKFLISQPQFYTFQEEQVNVNEGFFDFVIENKNVFLGHIYATNVLKNNYEEKIKQIMDKIQDDLEKKEMGLMIFTLFGALNNVQPSAEFKTMLEEYFDPSEDGPNCIFLVRHITFFQKTEYTPSQGDCLSNIPISSGKVIIQPVFNHRRSSEDHLNRPLGKEFRITSTRSYDEYGNQNGQPGYEFRANGSITWGGEDGVQVGGSLGAEAYDGRGNSVGLKAEQNSDGKGKVEVYGERGSEKGGH